MADVFAARSLTRALTTTRGNGVEAGVKPRESVVVYPSDALGDGSRVVVRAGQGGSR